MLGLRPLHAQDAARCQLIDIRPPRERMGGMGFVAGSISLPQSNDLRADASAIDRLAGHKLPILMCLTGQRSRGMVLAMARAIALPLGYLDGGLLAWDADDLPLAGRWMDDLKLSPLPPGMFMRRVRSDLDMLLEHVQAPLDTPAVLERCAAIVGCPVQGWTVREMHQLPDLLAIVLLDLAVPRTDVTVLVDDLLSRIPLSDPIRCVAS